MASSSPRTNVIRKFISIESKPLGCAASRPATGTRRLIEIWWCFPVYPNAPTCLACAPVSSPVMPDARKIPAVPHLPWLRDEPGDSGCQHAAWNDEAHVAENRRLYAEKFSQRRRILKPVLPVTIPDAASICGCATAGRRYRLRATACTATIMSLCCRAAFSPARHTGSIPARILCASRWSPDLDETVEAATTNQSQLSLADSR